MTSRGLAIREKPTTKQWVVLEEEDEDDAKESSLEVDQTQALEEEIRRLIAQIKFLNHESTQP